MYKLSLTASQTARCQTHSKHQQSSCGIHTQQGCRAVRGTNTPDAPFPPQWWPPVVAHSFKPTALSTVAQESPRIPCRTARDCPSVNGECDSNLCCTPAGQDVTDLTFCCPGSGYHLGRCCFAVGTSAAEASQCCSGRMQNHICVPPFEVRSFVRNQHCATPHAQGACVGSHTPVWVWVGSYSLQGLCNLHTKGCVECGAP